MHACRVVLIVCVSLLAAMGKPLWAADEKLPVDSTNAAVIKPAIDKFLPEQVAQLTAEDPAAASAARNAIVSKVQPGTPAPSGLFLDLYADEVNRALAPLAKHTDARVRLNVAIIAARVSEPSSSLKLVPLVVQLLKDDNEAVVLWALKATRSVIPDLLGNAVAVQNNPLMPAFLAAVDRSLKSAPAIQEAYAALLISKEGPNAVAPANWNRALPLAIDNIHLIMEKRIKLYREGIPPAPLAEQPPGAYLVLTGWTTKTDKQTQQQVKTVQLLSDLISAAAQRYGAASTSEKSELLGVLKRAGGAFNVIGQHVKNDALGDAGKKLGDLSSASNAQEVAERAGAIYPALKKVEQFSKIKEPEKLPQMTTTAPTTGPTTTP